MNGEYIDDPIIKSMSYEKVHVYFVPGLAAGKEIFRNIALPNSHYEIHILEWLIPEKKETLANYSSRMALGVSHSNAVLVGVSFGGVVAQEMNAYLNLKKLIIISSVKSNNEFPKRFTIAKKTFAYKLVPTRLILSSDDLTKFALGRKTFKRLKLYQEFLNVRDKRYLDWAIENLINWNRTKEIDGIYHLHGDKDVVFPIKNIRNAILIEGGTHIMLLNRGSEISRRLVDIIDNN